LRSAWIPAPPPESEPAMVKAVDGAAMAHQYAGWSPHDDGNRGHRRATPRG